MIHLLSLGIVNQILKHIRNVSTNKYNKSIELKTSFWTLKEKKLTHKDNKTKEK